jgi:L-ascorbate metabolism protein UlaG (beta-lactamase superfamily)
MDITWLGHAAFQLRGESQTVYIDPVAMDYGGAQTRQLFESAEPADIILLTHHHTDHCNPESFKRMRTASTIVVGPHACKDKVRGLLQEIEPGGTLTIGSTTIRAVHAYNIVRQREPGVPFHPKGAGVGYVVTIDGHAIYHAGDTEPIPEMADINGVEVILAPVDDHYTMSPEEAVQCASTVGARYFVPMHFFDTPVARVLAAATAAQGVALRMLDVGESLRLD